MNCIRMYLLSQGLLLMSSSIANVSIFYEKYWLLKDWILLAVQLNISLAIVVGAIWKNPKCSFLLILIVFVGIATAVYSIWFYMNHKNRITVVESRRMDGLLGPTWLTSDMDKIQKRLDCCGKFGYKDYKIPLPFSCCRKTVTILINEDDEGLHCTEYAEEGCLDLVASEKDNFEFWKLWFYILDGLMSLQCSVLFGVNYCYLKSSGE